MLINYLLKKLANDVFDIESSHKFESLNPFTHIYKFTLCFCFISRADARRATHKLPLRNQS